MDETKETPTVNKEALTRRDFLKLAGLVVGGSVLELLLSPIKNIGEFLIYINALPEGNPIQRLGIFNELNRRISFSPSNENKDLLVAWLKMNAAEYYFALKDKPLASQFIRHFLYGNSQAVDVSNSFVRGAIQSQEERARNGNLNLDEQWSSHNKDPLVRFFERTVYRSFTEDGEQDARILEPRGDSLKQLSKGQIPESRFLKYRVYPTFDYAAEDIFHSLGRYTLVGSGTIKDQPSFDDISRQLRVILAPSKFTIIDRYDWRLGDSKRAAKWNVADVRLEPYIFDFLKAIGVKEPVKTVHDLVGPERFNQLSHVISNVKVGFSDEEGYLIERTNYGHPFDISGTINLSGLELRIPQTIFKQSLEQ